MSITAISKSDANNLAKLERVVEKGRKAFLEVGNALKEIRDGKLYRATHKTFAAYVEDRFEIKRHYAMNLIQAADVAENVDNCQQIEFESHAREVAKAPPEKQQAVVDRAEVIAEERGKKPTAAIVAEARKEVLAEIVDEDEYEDVDDQDEEPGSGLQVSFKDIENDFRLADNRMDFVRDLLSELEEHEIVLLRAWLEEYQ